MLDTLIVFALLGAIVGFILYVLPRQCGGKEGAATPHSIFPE